MVTEVADIKRVLFSRKPGDKMEIVIKRGGTKRTITIGPLKD
jgi:hypothetical protein